VGVPRIDRSRTDWTLRRRPLHLRA
jgi:hypothetical protein